MKLSKLKQAIADTNTNAAAGVWLSFSQFGAGLKLKIARANSGSNPAFRNISERLFDPYRDKRSGKLDFEGVDAEKLNTTLHEIYATSVVLDWNVTDDDGNKVAYSADMMREFFAESGDLFDDVMRRAKELDTFAVRATDADAKKS